MKNYLFKLSAFSLFYLFCSCSQDTMNTSYYEEYGDNHWSSLTRSFSVEEDKIAAEIQEKIGLYWSPIWEGSSLSQRL